MTLVLVALLLAAPASPSPEVRAEVAALLGRFDRAVSPESFRRFGAEGEAALVDIALSGDLPPRRARALEVLAALRGPEAEATHRAVAGSDAPRSVRRAAVLGLGRLLQADRAPAALAPFLERDRDPAVRAAAADALAGAAPAEGCAAVRAQLYREDAEGAVRFRRAVSACERAAAGR